MLRGNLMKLSQNVLSKSGRELLAGGFMCEDLRDMWFDKDSILDHLYNGDLGSLRQGDYNDLPEEFWKVLGLKEDVRDVIREHVESGGEMLFTEY